MTTPVPDAENAYRVRALVGMARFMIHHLNLAPPWQIGREDRSLIILLTGGNDAAIDEDEPAAALPPQVTNALVALSTLDESRVPQIDLHDPLYGNLLLSIARQFDPSSWVVRRILPDDPLYVLLSAPHDAFVVECQLGDATSLAMLFFPALAMAERFCRDGERILASYRGRSS